MFHTLIWTTGKNIADCISTTEMWMNILGNTFTRLQGKQRHRNVVFHDSCDFTACIALRGHNIKLRMGPCELGQTVETGCSWELPVSFRIFLVPFSSRFIQPVTAIQGCHGLKRLKVCFASLVSAEKTYVTTGTLFKYSWTSCGICYALIKWRAHPTVKISGLLEIEI